MAARSHSGSRQIPADSTFPTDSAFVSLNPKLILPLLESFLRMYQLVHFRDDSL